MATEEQLINLEAKLAHQEQSILELSEEIYKQQKQIAQLEQTCQFLLAQVRAIEKSGGLATSGGPAESASEKPPHY
jgi:SlyX protein